MAQGRGGEGRLAVLVLRQQEHSKALEGFFVKLGELIRPSHWQDLKPQVLLVPQGRRILAAFCLEMREPSLRGIDDRLLAVVRDVRALSLSGRCILPICGL
jgi:hypothetical protein